MHDPSTFRVFLTDQNNLRWDSLKESPEVKVEEVPDKNKLDPGHYYLDVKLPDDYSSGAKSILYIMWERDERPHETFFSCSDVIIKDL
ncbi:hypothetical protein PS417_25145 [Pseudomonas simiae]|uniref:Chitin-binding type-4 domain-containing protein n=2 Tax=Pseudomonas simiae TaxID=321846 RepID=A0A1N7UFS5_9PSED|nr:hypothetical protein PS417_25145 [Pseudomonas simiae]